MERLFDYALNDPRENVSIEALDDLVLLAHNDIAVDTSRVYVSYFHPPTHLFFSFLIYGNGSGFLNW